MGEKDYKNSSGNSPTDKDDDFIYVSFKKFQTFIENPKNMSARDRNVIEYACKYYCEGYRNDSTSKIHVYNDLKGIFRNDHETINATLGLWLCICDRNRKITITFDNHLKALLAVIDGA